MEMEQFDDLETEAASYARTNLQHLSWAFGLMGLFIATTKVVVDNVRSTFETLRDLGAATYLMLLFTFAWSVGALVVSIPLDSVGDVVAACSLTLSVVSPTAPRLLAHPT